ncbi:MAG: TAXI family TRAP transporter solute-binding subunit, partial [Holophagales bacterium]|nr:TAXI family TRAP transporter solute-binding subunit [Holophagales bacterium]
MADPLPKESPADPDPARRGGPEYPRAEGDERRKALLQVWLPVVLLAAAAFAYTFTKLEPPAPRELVIAAGASGGAYYPVAESYAESVAQYELTLEVRETAGSVENLRLLEAGEVDLALVQGGAADPKTHAGLETLGSVFLEPVWLFHRSGLTLDSFSDLEGQRVATGAEGSGTRSLVAALLEVAGLGGRIEELGAPSAEAVRALRAGELDAAFFVASAGASYVRELLADPGVSLFSVRRDRAFQVRFPFLSRVVLGEGVVDIDDNLPPRDISLLASAAMVVARRDLHHALVPVLVEAMSKAHGEGGIFEQAGFFPSAQLVDLPLKIEAAHYIENGPSFLYRILPYRSAAAVDRLAILL